MGAIPTQRETAFRASDAPAHGSAEGRGNAERRGSGEQRGSLEQRSGGVRPRAQKSAALPGSPLAPGSARAIVRAALTEWAEVALPGTEHLTDRLADDAVVVVSELVTNAVVHAGTDVEVACRLEEANGDVVVEVCDHHPSRAPRDPDASRAPRDADPSRTPRDPDRPGPHETPEHGRGLRLVATLASSWGVTYRRGAKTVWARLSAEGTTAADGIEEYTGRHAVTQGLDAAEILAPEPLRAEYDREWLDRGALSFLAEASDLLAGQLDENLVAALAGQLIVPRLADWCAVWLEDEATGRGGWADGSGGTGLRLARVWHGSENRIEDLRRALEKEPPHPADTSRSGPAGYPWPEDALGPHGTALAYRLIAGGRPLGTLVIGRAGLLRFPDEVTGLIEDLSRRVALAVGAARQYARQATISRVLQRGLLPVAVAEIPGVRSALVYEPCDKGGPSGDFYDLFPAGDGRWCFAVGDVQGKGPEAAVVIGLARPWLRLLAREGYRVADVLDRLNRLLLDDATEAADAAARALVRPPGPGDGPQTRFLSLLYGELAPFDGGVRCTLASAGHPLPLLLGPDGSVCTAARPQTLLGVIEDETYTSETFELRPGDTLLCVTDGVTERRSGLRQFDDADGLATAFAGCAGLSAELIAERIRRLVHEFGGRPPEDDLALLVLQAEQAEQA
ncbi:SpoIIE family protein phosphatase [Streptomyces sp. NPDC092369]|uniref:SpoIIE family protein phosphatase n=1 Tax=Streptomyces sp. NPDC092369 TaxID=3366015 RepID=UPI00380AA816